MSEPLLVGLSLALLVAVLWPTLAMPYLGDDTFNAYLDGWIGYERLSLADAFAKLFFETNAGVGRFYPIFPAILFFDFHVVRDPAIVKSLVLAAVAINATTFYILVRTFAPALALPTLALLPAALQIRFFHDPIVQFSLHMQVAFEFASLGMLALVWYAKSRSIAPALLSVGAYLLAALTYEATYAFVVVYGILAYALVDDRRSRARLCGAYALVPLTCCAIVLLERARVPFAPDATYTLAPNFAASLHALWLQTVGAVPLMYALANPGDFLPPISAMWGAPATWPAALAAFATAAATFSRSIRSGAIARTRTAVAFGVALVVSSGALISLTARWQHELAFGLAYTPVYFASFGVAIVLAAAAVAVVRRWPRVPTVAVVGLAAAFLVATTYRANALALAHFKQWSTVAPRAIDAGVLAQAREGDTVYLDDSYPAHAIIDGQARWNARYYLFAHAGKRLIAASLAGLPPSPGSATFALEGVVPDFTTGRVAAGRIVAVARVAQSAVPLVVSARRFEASRAASSLQAFESRCGSVPLENVRDDVASGLLVRYDDAVSFPENDGGVPFRWASGPSRILVVNPTDRPHRATLSFVVRPATAGARVRFEGRASSPAPSSTVPSPESGGADVRATVEVNVAPGASHPVAVDADGPAVPGNPGGRVLRFEIRDVTIAEPACGGAQPISP